jgi:hypothetical protein
MQASALLPELEQYGRARAAGILSRAALDLDSDGVYPEGSGHLDEKEIREYVLRKVQDHIRQMYPTISEDDLKQRVLDFWTKLLHNWSRQSGRCH